VTSYGQVKAEILESFSHRDTSRIDLAGHGGCRGQAASSRGWGLDGESDLSTMQNCRAMLGTSLWSVVTHPPRLLEDKQPE